MEIYHSIHRQELFWHTEDRHTKKERAELLYSAWCGTCARTTISFLGLCWSWQNSNLQKQEICNEHGTSPKVQQPRTNLQKLKRDIQKNSISLLLPQERKTFQHGHYNCESFLYHGWVLPLLPLFFSPEQVESNSAFDGFIRVKISTLSRKNSILGTERRGRWRWCYFLLLYSFSSQQDRETWSFIYEHIHSRYWTNLR